LKHTIPPWITPFFLCSGHFLPAAGFLFQRFLPVRVRVIVYVHHQQINHSHDEAVPADQKPAPHADEKHGVQRKWMQR
jgi:hypothetical protein